MKNITFNIALASSLFALSSLSQAITTESATQFFDRYQALSSNFDAAVVDLYADEGQLLSSRRSADGSEQTMALPFSSLKAMLPKLLVSAKQAGDVSDYSNVRVALLDETSAKITATRYSNLNCFSDDSYYMVVQESDTGKLAITEEHSVTLAQGLCETNKALIGTLSATADAYNAQLPAMVDADTELSSVTAQGTSMAYNYKLVGLAAEDIVDNLADVLREGVVQSSCDMNPSKTLLERGATLVFNYTSLDDVLMDTVLVKQADCEG